jgi:hypothetical protein
MQITTAPNTPTSWRQKKIALTIVISSNSSDDSLTNAQEVLESRDAPPRRGEKGKSARGQTEEICKFKAWNIEEAFRSEGAGEPDNGLKGQIIIWLLD